MNMDMKNVPNKTEYETDKINDILNSAITDYEDKIEKMKGNIALLKEQRKEGIKYTNSAQYLGMAIITIIIDILTGFGDAVDKIRTKAKQHIQGGGVTPSLDETANSFDNIIKKSKDEFTSLYDKIRKGELGAIDIGKSIGSDILLKIKDMGEASIKTGIKWSADYINAMMNMGLMYTGQYDILDTPLDKLSPELNKKIVLLAGVLNEIAGNPATREAIQEISKAIAITAVEILEEIRPELNKIMDKSLEMFQEASDKGIRGATATAISGSSAFISTVPFVGGVINLMLALGKGFNVLMELYNIFVDKGGRIVVDSGKMINNVKDTFDKGKNRIISALPTNANANANAKLPKKGGCKKTNRGINKFDNRLRKTIKSFSSTLPKLKFPLFGKKSRKNGRKR